MEVKKNAGVDLTRKSGFFFSIALLITMSLVLTAFEWRQYEAKLDDLVQRRTNNFEMIEPPITEILPPPPPPVPMPVIVEVPDKIDVPDDVKPLIDISTSTEESLPVIEIKPLEIPEEVTDEPFRFVESPASFDGGLGAFYEHVGDEIKYPAQARRMNIEGKVFVEFVINRDGTVTEVKAIKRIGGGCDEEAERVIKTSPRWNPGKQRGKPVRQKMVLPVTFRLNSN
jgi:protein TonB